MSLVFDHEEVITRRDIPYRPIYELLQQLRDCECSPDHAVTRVAIYAVIIARNYGVTDNPTLQDILVAALLHDTGKLHLDPRILNKPGPLTPTERAHIEKHPVVGGELIEKIPGCRPLADIVRAHHEWWNGKGYPQSLCGEDIPLTSRIIAVADAFEALISDRPYRAAYSIPDAMKIIRQEAGTHFDPNVVSAFLRITEGKWESLRRKADRLALTHLLHVKAA